MAQQLGKSARLKQLSSGRRAGPVQGEVAGKFNIVGFEAQTEDSLAYAHWHLS